MNRAATETRGYGAPPPGAVGLAGIEGRGWGIERSMNAVFVTLSILCVLSACGGDEPPDGEGRDVAKTDAVDTSESETETDTDPDDAEADTNDGDTSTGEVGDGFVLPGSQPPDRDEARGAASGPFLAGVAALPLDPPIGVSMGGFGNRTGPTDSPWTDMFFASVGSHGHLYLKALAFEVAGERLVLLKLPLPFSEDSLTHAMHDALMARYGLDLEGRVITAATHTHHGPARFWRLPPPLGIAGIDNADDELIARFGERMAETVAAAIDDLAPAQWGFATKVDWDPDDLVYRDRRGSNDPRWGKDPRLTVLGLRREGQPLAVMANFAMHGTILGSDNTLLSDDAGGGFEEELERRAHERLGLGVLGVFTQAGGGDAAPAGDRKGHVGHQRLQMVGVEGADKVLDLFEGLTWRSDSELAVRSRSIAIAHDYIYGDSGEFDGPNGHITNGTLQCTIDPAGGISQEGQPKDCIELAGVFDLLGLTLPHPELNQTYLTVARLGPLFFMTMPGEPTHSITEYARDQVEALGQAVMVVGYSQDHLLYFTHPDDWYTGEYEAEFSLWGPWAGRWIVDRQVATVRAMLAGNNGPTWYEEVDDFSPSLSDTRRPLERSLESGTVTRQPVATPRLGVVEVEVRGGDPALGLPLFVIEREEAGTFTPVLEGGRVLDSARLDGFVLYRPVPENSADLLAEREHRWVFRWQVAPWMPAGRYRVVASGRALESAEVADWEVTSAAFDISQDPEAEVEVTSLGAGRFRLRLTHPPAPLTLSGTGRQGGATDPASGTPVSGWRVFDPRVGPTERIEVRVPLAVTASRGQVRLEVVISDGVLDLSGTSLADGDGVTLSVHLADDRVPSPLEVSRP